MSDTHIIKAFDNHTNGVTGGPSNPTSPPETPPPTGSTDRPDCNVYAFWGEKYDEATDSWTLYLTNNRDDMKVKVLLDKLLTAIGVGYDEDPPWAWLSEGELLSTKSISTWIIYCSCKYRPNSTPIEDDGGNIEGIDKHLTVGDYCGRLIYGEEDWEMMMVNNSLKSLMTIGSSFGPSVGVQDVETDKELYEKLRIVYNFVSDIYRQYYGKDFIVQVENSAYDICVKDRVGGQVSSPAPDDIHLYRALRLEQTDSVYRTTDQTATDGAWIKPGQTELLDLGVFNETRNFQKDGSKIGCFCKVSPINKIEKVVNSGPKFDYILNLGTIGSEDFYVKNIGDNEYVYVNADVQSQMYYIEDKVWVRFILGSVPSLRLDPTGQNVIAEGVTNAAMNAAQILLGQNYTKDNLDDGLSVNPGNERIRKVEARIFENDTSGGGDATPTPAAQGLTLASYEDNHISALAAEEDRGDNAPGARVVGNLSSANIVAMHPICEIPYGVALPMKSNIFVYGPWASVYDPTGGTEVTNEDILAPWNFVDVESPYYNDGYSFMDMAGNGLALDGPRGRQYHEEGTISAAELPANPLGFVGGGNSVVLTNLTVSMGASQGLVTTYSFKTYTPKVVAPTKHILDEMNKIKAIKQQINQYIREDRNQARKYSNALKQALQNITLGGGPAVSTDPTLDVDGVHDRASPSEVLMSYYSATFKKYKCGAPDFGDSAIYDSKIEQGLCKSTKYVAGKGWVTTLSRCDPCDNPPGPDPLKPAPESGDGNDKFNWSKAAIHPNYYFERFQTDNTYKLMAITSLDAVFLPVSLKGGPDGLFARYGKHNKVSGICYKPGGPQRSKSRCEIPPFIIPQGCCYDLPINQKYLNPMLSKAIIDNTWTDGRLVEDHGFLIQTIAYGEDYTRYPLGNANVEVAREVQDQEDFRFSALRGPLVLQSWGYDTSGKPIPNAIDCADRAAKGQFQKYGLKDRFMDHCMKNPKTWPVGPIDLRWDRDRGVWVCPPPNKIVVARLKEELLPYQMAVAELLNPEAAGVEFYQEYAIWGPNGENVKKSIRNAEIKVYDYLGVKLCKNDIIYASYDDGRYIILESSRTYDPNLQCCRTSTTTTTSSTTSIPSFAPTTATPCWCGLECLQTLENFDWCKKQALIHDDKCLLWEDIVECYPADIGPTPCDRIPINRTN